MNIIDATKSYEAWLGKQIVLLPGDLRRKHELMAEAVFRAWRALPRDFSPGFAERLIGLWRRLGSGRTAELGGRGFRALAVGLGPLRAARLLRRWQARPYAASRTMTDAEFEELLGSLPPP